MNKAAPMMSRGRNANATGKPTNISTVDPPSSSTAAICQDIDAPRNRGLPTDAYSRESPLTIARAGESSPPPRVPGSARAVASVKKYATSPHHGRTCSGHPRLSSRPKVVDGREEHGHDAVSSFVPAKLRPAERSSYVTDWFRLTRRSEPAPALSPPAAAIPGPRRSWSSFAHRRRGSNFGDIRCQLRMRIERESGADNDEDRRESIAQSHIGNARGQ